MWAVHVFMLLSLLAVVHPAQEEDFECYVCKNSKGIECDDDECFDECNDDSDISTCTMSRPWCEIEVKNHGGDMYMKKRCTQQEACLNQEDKNEDDCYVNNGTIGAGCTFCCNETLCNYNLTVSLRAGANTMHVTGSLTFCGFVSYLLFHKF